jgi:hypothetical protein
MGYYTGWKDDHDHEKDRKDGWWGKRRKNRRRHGWGWGWGWGRKNKKD